MMFDEKRGSVVRATDDLRRRTLAQFARPLDRLIYLASTRDYNTGVYYHDGLASIFTEEVACQALADCHREVFKQVLDTSLESLVGQIEGYIETGHLGLRNFLAAWQKIEPFRVILPMETDPLAAEFLFSNLRTALAILETRSTTDPPPEGPAASPLQSLGQ